MMSRRGVISLASAILLCAVVVAPAGAQSPSVLYTWDHAIGEAVGPNLEGWSKAFGTNAIALDNAVDGTLTITETGAAGTGWATGDNFNRIKEAFNPLNYGGIDLTGMSSLEVNLGHNGPNPVGLQVYSQVTNTSSYAALANINVLPGPAQTYSIPLSGLSPLQISAMRTIGLNVSDHVADGNLTWQFNEVRSAGVPLATRIIANHDDGAADLDGALVNYHDTAIIGHSAGQNNTGLSINTIDGALQWDETAGGLGAAITWGNGNNLVALSDFAARPMDGSNYLFAKVRVRVQSTVPGENVPVQYYLQTRNYGFNVAGTQDIPADAQYHELTFPLSGVSNLAEIQWHGIDFGAHTGQTRYRVDYVVYTSVPEPASMLMLLVGAVSAMFCRPRKSSKLASSSVYT
jgi:hypothetical protein